MRKPFFGELQAKQNPEAYIIWNTRDVEPEFCEPYQWNHELVTDDDHSDLIQIAKLLWEMLSTLPPREKDVLKRRCNGETLEEIANALGVTRERIRQIEARALRKMKHPERLGALRDLHTPWYGYAMLKYRPPEFHNLAQDEQRHSNS